MLVLRLVDHCDKGDWHIAQAHYGLPHNAIVTLECLCGKWAFGRLIRDGLCSFRRLYPTATVCEQCLLCFSTMEDVSRTQDNYYDW